MTSKVAEKMLQHGWGNVAILRFPNKLIPAQTELSADLSIFDLSEPTDQRIQEIIAKIQSEAGPIGTFIHLHPQSEDTFEISTLFPESEQQIIKSVFFLAKHLSQPLVEAASSHRSCFITLTRLNGKLGFGSTTNSSVLQGGLYGLVKTATIEWNNVFCRSVDFAPGMSDESIANCLDNELYDPDLRLTDVGYDGDKRLTLSTEIENSDEEIVAGSSIPENATFLVAGGAKGVTAACVQELAKRDKCKFILLGRTEFPVEEPDFLKGIIDENEMKKLSMEHLKASGEKPTPVKINNFLKPVFAQREIQETLASIKSAGSEAIYLSTDIHNAELLKAKLSSVVEKTGPVTGIIHGAGVLADKLIQEKTEDDFDNVVSTKLKGLQSMLASIDPSKLRHLVLFSSAAAFYGNEAQSDYALANEVLNKFAHLFKMQYPECHVIAFDWGPWDGGMVTPELKRLFEQRNVNVIPIDVGSKIMANELTNQNKAISQVVVGNSMVVPDPFNSQLATYSIERTIRPELNRFLSSHIIGKDAVLPIITALSWMADTCEQLYPGYRFQSSEDTSVLKGIVLKDDSPLFCNVQIKELEKSDEGYLQLDVLVSSPLEEGKSLNHYRSKISLASSMQEQPVYDQVNLKETEPQSGEEFYTNGTLFHGPLFQSVNKQLNANEKGLTLLCNSPHVNEEESAQFQPIPFNAFADDTQLQALLIWVRQYHQTASLPLKIGRGIFFRHIPFNTSYYITLEVVSSTDTKLIANTFVHDEDGNLYSQLIGAEAVISKALDSKFLESSPTD